MKLVDDIKVTKGLTKSNSKIYLIDSKILMNKFIKVFYENGGRVRNACEIIDVHARYYYLWRERHQQFAEITDEILIKYGKRK